MITLEILGENVSQKYTKIVSNFFLSLKIKAIVLLFRVSLYFSIIDKIVGKNSGKVNKNWSNIHKNFNQYTL